VTGIPETAATEPVPAVPGPAEDALPEPAEATDLPEPAEPMADVEAAAAEPAEAVAEVPRQIPNGRLLSKRYRLAQRIAAGGMGEVWRGTDELLGRPVAVKLLSAAHAADEQFRSRFRAEARYAASLSHPGIAQVYDYGESYQDLPGNDRPPGSGVAYLVMELVEGEALSAALARDGQMSADATLDLVAQAAKALAAAHAAGIVHRDIKPGNLLITPDHQVKITDFGIARAVLAAHLTQTGMVMGTAQYVSPEQASARPVTTSTDIYSLGVVAYECLAGRPPFTADTPIALALAHVKNQPPPLPASVPPRIAALVGQMLAKEPAKRPASAQAVADRASALSGTPVAGEGPWIIESAELADPTTWFSDPSPTSPALPHAGTGPMTGAADRHARSRRSAVLIFAIVGLVGALTGGTIAVVTASRHPAATVSTSSTVRAHRTDGPSPRTTRVPSFFDAGTLAPRLAPPSVTPTRRASSPPSVSPAPSTTLTSPSPSTSPSETPTQTPTPTPTGTVEPTDPSQAPQEGS